MIAIDLAKTVFWLLLIGLWLTPAVAGLTDIACWFAVNAQCTPIQWTEARVVFATCWFFGWPLLMICVSV